MEMILSNPILNSLMISLITILIDTVLGIMVSLKNKEFDVSKLPQFIATNLFPYIGGLVVIGIGAYYISSLEYLFYAGNALVIIKFSKEALIDKLKILFS